MTIDKIKVFFLAYYGPENPQHKWYITLTILAFFMLFRNSRRPSAILFAVVCFSWAVAGFLLSAFSQYGPD